MEEQIWNYIDGTCTEQEKRDFEKLLATDATVRKEYERLLKAHQLFSSAELEEPSMRFTMNVMDAINAAVKLAPLKTTVDLRIIKSIGFFFITSIAALLIYALSQMQFTLSPASIFNWNFEIDMSKIFSSTAINIFIMVNVVIALLLVDKYLHWKKFEKKYSA